MPKKANKITGKVTKTLSGSYEADITVHYSDGSTTPTKLGLPGKNEKQWTRDLSNHFGVDTTGVLVSFPSVGIIAPSVDKGQKER